MRLLYFARFLLSLLNIALKIIKSENIQQPDENSICNPENGQNEKKFFKNPGIMVA
jgi:hypothetical protein